MSGFTQMQKIFMTQFPTTVLYVSGWLKNLKMENPNFLIY